MDRGALLMPGLVIVVLAAIGVSEQLTKPPEADNRIHITYWEKWTDFEFDAMRKVVDEFNRSQDRITVDILSVSSIENKTMVAVAGGIPPDVAGLYGGNVAQYADNKAIIPLDDYCHRKGIKRDQYIAPFWDSSVVDGHIYALVSTPASTALHYNRDMLQKAGYDPDKPPTTFEQMDAMADKLTLRDKTGRIVQSGFLPTEPGWWNFAWGNFFGGRLWDGDTKLTANEKENVRAYEWIQGYSKRYGSGDIQTFRSGLGNFQSPQNAFMMKQVAMEIQGVWMYNFIDKFAPTLKWSAAPFPHPADRPDLDNPTIIDLDVLAIPTGAKHPDEAFEFIAYVQSQKAMELLCLGQRKNSPLKKVSPEFWKQHPNPYIRLFTDLPYSKNAISVPKMGIWPEYRDALNAATDEIVLMRKTPKQALDDVTKEMQPKWDEYRLRKQMRDKL